MLSLALLYGANASGKSNLVRAMDFARHFIIKGTRPKQAIPVETFRLDKSCANRPSRFEGQPETRHRWETAIRVHRIGRRCASNGGATWRDW